MPHTHENEGKTKKSAESAEKTEGFYKVPLSALHVAGAAPNAWLCALAVHLLCWRRERILTLADFREATGLTDYRISVGTREAAELGWLKRKPAGGKIYYYSPGKWNLT